MRMRHRPCSDASPSPFSWLWGYAHACALVLGAQREQPPAAAAAGAGACSNSGGQQETRADGLHSAPLGSPWGGPSPDRAARARARHLVRARAHGLLHRVGHGNGRAARLKQAQGAPADQAPIQRALQAVSKPRQVPRQVPRHGAEACRASTAGQRARSHSDASCTTRKSAAWRRIDPRAANSGSKQCVCVALMQWRPGRKRLRQSFPNTTTVPH